MYQGDGRENQQNNQELVMTPPRVHVSVKIWGLLRYAYARTVETRIYPSFLEGTDLKSCIQFVLCTLRSNSLSLEGYQHHSQVLVT